MQTPPRKTAAPSRDSRTREEDASHFLPNTWLNTLAQKRGQTLEQILGDHMVASFVPQG
jgi:hypothetical protein